MFEQTMEMQAAKNRRSGLCLVNGILGRWKRPAIARGFEEWYWHHHDSKRSQLLEDLCGVLPALRDVTECYTVDSLAMQVCICIVFG